jgi:hypothetical protein
MTTYAHAVTLEDVTCVAKGCGTLFALTTTHIRKLRETGRDFYCPNGHSLSYPRGKSDADKLRDERDRAEKLEDALFTSIIAAEEMRGTILRDRERFAAGLCPCCRRSFDNVRRHMADQHPDYAVQRVAELAKPAKVLCSCGRDFTNVHGLHIHQSRQRVSGWWKPTTSPRSAHLTKV